MENNETGTGLGLHSVKIYSNLLGGDAGYLPNNIMPGSVFWFIINIMNY